MSFELKAFVFLSYFAVSFALKISFYPSFGQIKQEISVKNGYFQTYFAWDEYNSIVSGTIDFPGQKVLEQDLYSSQERLRNTNIYAGPSLTLAKLVDPYQFLIKTNSNRYTYAAYNAVEYTKDPLLNGKTLSVRFSNPSITKMNMTYITRGLYWTPRYEVMIVNERYATLRALADIYNSHERTYDAGHSRLIAGDIPLGIRSSEVYYSYSTDVSKSDVSTLSIHSYNITRRFHLLPKSIKSYPFLTPRISLKPTFESSIYLQSTTQSGFFQRTFSIQASEFLPAGLVTFYLQNTSACLGQGRFVDTPKNKEQIIQLGIDSDVEYKIQNTVTDTQTQESRVQGSTVNIVISNRKDKKSVNTKLKITSGFISPKFKLRKCSSSNIQAIQDVNDQSMIRIQANLKANTEESCTFHLNLSSPFN